MQGTLAWPLEHAARPHGNKLAVIDGARQLTYRELHERVRRLGRGRRAVSENATADSFDKNLVFARCESHYATSVFSLLSVVSLDLTA